MGRLLDGVFEVSSNDQEAASAVFFVDEINRGNTSRIFGEFITFMDFDYRDSRADGSANPLRLPIPLPSLNASGPNCTEPVARPSGDAQELPIPWYFPRDVYMVATMNSVDRAAVPLDSALARRFDRIELRPDMNVLASHLELSIADVEAKALEVRSGTDPDAWTTLSAGETAILLLDRLNVILAADLGEDFELGHGLFWDVRGAEASRWEELAIAWDEIVYPQLLDRYVARPADLRRVLKVDEPPNTAEYAFRPRAPMGGGATDAATAIAPVRLSDVDSAVLMTTLRWLAL
jgi:5-methylcytosine-specific restriction protein B